MFKRNKRIVFALLATAFVLFSGTVRSSDYALGDADGSGRIDIFDALAVAEYRAFKNKPGYSPPPGIDVADVTGDGVVDIHDAVRIARFDVGLIENFGEDTDLNPPEFGGIGLVATSNADAVFLSWLPATDDVTPTQDIVYKVYYSDKPDFTPADGILYDEITGETEISVTGLSPVTKYYFLVTASDETGNSGTGADESDSGYRTATTAETDIKIRESVVLKDIEKLELPAPAANEETGEYVFDSADPGIAQIGEYIVGKDSDGRGFLRKVDAVRQENGKTVMETSQASLDDVIEPLKLDSTVTLSEISAEEERYERRSGSGSPIVFRRSSSTGGSLVVEETDYVPVNDAADKDAFMLRVSRRTGMKAGSDSTGRLVIRAQNNRKVRPPYSFVLPVQAYLVDENGQTETQQELGITVSLVSLSNSEIPDTSGNYGAEFVGGKLGWLISEDHVSDRPYRAKFRAEALFSGLTAELEVDIYVLPQGKYNSTLGAKQEFGVNVDYFFEPALRSNVDTNWRGKVTEGEIVATGAFGVTIDAFYNLDADADFKADKLFFQRTWTTAYMLAGVPVYQDITMYLNAEVNATAHAAISAGAAAELSTYLELGIQYNPETEKWDFVNTANFQKSLTFDLGVEGTVEAELRLIPHIDVTFYKVATGSVFIEPYLKGRAEAEWITEGDVLRQLVISQYEMKELSAWLGIEAYFAANLRVWKANLWEMEKTSLFDPADKFKFYLFSLPELSLTSSRDSEPGSPLVLTATVKDGVNNPFKPESVSWNAYPGGRFSNFSTYSGPPLSPDTVQYKAEFRTDNADAYKIYFSGNSGPGALSRQYDFTETDISYDQLHGVPRITEITPADGDLLVKWEADAEQGATFNLYMASEPGVTGKNYASLNDGDRFEDVSSPFTLTGLKNGIMYYVVVTAVDSTGESDESAEVSEKPAAILPPEGVEADAGDGEVTVSWVSDAFGFNLYLAKEPGVTRENYESLPGGDRIPGVASPYTVKNLENGATYYFVVTAVDVNGRESGESVEKPAMPEAAGDRPEAPKNVMVSPGNGQVTVSWDEVAGAAAYEILVSENESMTAGISGENATSPQVIKNLENGKTYYFAVVASNDAGDKSDMSEVKPAMPVSSGELPTIEELGMKFVLIPAGEFWMGCSRDSDKDGYCYGDEEPYHKVKVSSFYMQTTEVTQGQWEKVMGDNPSYFKNCKDQCPADEPDCDCPVENVRWTEVRDFIIELNKKGEGTFRLPSEAEWEYAARAESVTTFANGGMTHESCTPADPKLDEIGWYCGNSESKTHPVAKKIPNKWGLYDMHGNVWEWVQDEWHSNYDGAPETSSEAWQTSPESGSDRVFRGGSWCIAAGYCRSAERRWYDPSARYKYLGFRLVFSPGQ